MLSHWESFKKVLLPLLHPAVRLGLSDPLEMYNKSLEEYSYPDVYTFSKLPFMKFCDQHLQLSLRAGMGEIVSNQQYRVLVEEAYAVMTFEQQGCRIIKPSPAMVMELLNTDTNFKLTEIRPPWPHVYVQMPKGLGLNLPDFYEPGTLREIDGYYVTWSESCPEVKHLLKLRRESGGKVEASQDAALAGLTETEIVALYGPEGRFGDWLARFLMHTCDNKSEKIHEHTVRYFNMRWDSDNVEEVDSVYQAFMQRWEKSKELDAQPQGHDLQEKIFKFTINLFAYMALPQAARDVIWKPDEDRERLRNAGSAWNSKRRRNLRNRLREEMRTETWEVGQTIVIQRRQARAGEAGEGEIGTSPRTHWRRGHISHYWIGAHDSPDRHKEARYIHPMLIMGRGPVPESTTMVVK